VEPFSFWSVFFVSGLCLHFEGLATIFHSSPLFLLPVQKPLYLFSSVSQHRHNQLILSMNIVDPVGEDLHCSPHRSPSTTRPDRSAQTVTIFSSPTQLSGSSNLLSPASIRFPFRCRRTLLLAPTEMTRIHWMILPSWSRRYLVPPTVNRPPSHAPTPPAANLIFPAQHPPTYYSCGAIFPVLSFARIPSD